jgi:hypothetical protein
MVKGNGNAAAVRMAVETMTPSLPREHKSVSE